MEESSPPPPPPTSEDPPAYFSFYFFCKGGATFTLPFGFLSDYCIFYIHGEEARKKNCLPTIFFAACDRPMMSVQVVRVSLLLWEALCICYSLPPQIIIYLADFMTSGYHSPVFESMWDVLEWTFVEWQ